MISRIIEAKPEDMRAFVEEAAGISRYKERRKETESRVADTRENLERLQDVRDEVDKQIRHLQRQAATARRYQAFKEQERRLTAELLALQLRDLDSGAQVHDSAMRERDLAMQAAARRPARRRGGDREAARVSRRAERALAAVQGRYYEVGARHLPHRADDPAHPRAARTPAHRPGAGARARWPTSPPHIERDERQLAAAARGDRAARTRASPRRSRPRAARRPKRSRPRAGSCSSGSSAGSSSTAALGAAAIRRRRSSARASSSSRTSCGASRRRRSASAWSAERSAAQDRGAQLGAARREEALARERERGAARER